MHSDCWRQSEPSMLAFLRKNQVPAERLFLSPSVDLHLIAGALRQLKNEPLGALLMWIMRPLQIASQGAVSWIPIFGKITTRSRDSRI